MFQPKDSLPAYYNSEFVKLQDNWDTVVTEALELLKETDGLAVGFVETNFDDGTQIDEESGDYFDETEKWISKTNPLEENKKDSKKTESSGNDMNAKFLEMINSSKLNLNI